MSYDYYYTDDIEREMNSLKKDNQRPNNYGLAIASLILGVVSLVFFLFVLNIFTAVTGIIMGIVFLSTSRGYKKGKGLAIGGIVTSILSIVLCIGSYVVIFQNADSIIEMRNPSIYYDYNEDDFDDYFDYFNQFDGTEDMDDFYRDFYNNYNPKDQLNQPDDTL